MAKEWEWWRIAIGKVKTKPPFFYLPGDIRELENAIEHAFMHPQGLYLTRANFPSELHGVGIKEGTKEIEEIRHALKKTRGNKTAAAKLLGIGRATLWRKLKNSSH